MDVVLHMVLDLLIKDHISHILAEKLKIDSVETEAQRGVSNAYIVRNTITNLSVKIAEGEKIDFVANPNDCP